MRKERPLSWSAISSFQYDPEQWARKYVDGIIDPPNASMLFGNKVGEEIGKNPKFLPDVPRYSIFEKKLTGKIGTIELIGFLDSFQQEPMAFFEYKTSSNRNKWTQRSAEQHGQILMYMFLLWQMYNIRPEDITCELVYIPVEETGSFEMMLSAQPSKRFPVKHTMREVLNFMCDVKQIYRDMQKYRELRQTFKR